MGKVSIFGVSGSGKTCYLYAMSQVLSGGAVQDGFKLSIIANDPIQERQLNEGYLKMAGGEWPESTSVTTEYDFCVRTQYEGMYREIIPNLTLFDYAGSIWTDDSDTSLEERDRLMHAFSESSSLIFLMDGVTLLQAMDPANLSPIHRMKSSIEEVAQARRQIAFVEALFRNYKQNKECVPPVMVVVTKSDVFADDDEILQGKVLVKESLPSIFARGSGVDAAITNVSLGTQLGTVNGRMITGNLSLSTEFNVHMPMVYALYAFLNEVYEGSPKEEQMEIEKWAVPLRAMMRNKVELFSNGNRVIAL